VFPRQSLKASLAGNSILAVSLVYEHRGNMEKQVYLLCGALLPTMICSGIIYSIFALYVSQLGASVTQIGTIYTLGAVAGLVIAPFVGRLSDRYGRRPIILFCLASLAGVFFLYALATSYLTILPVQALEGATWAALGTVVPALVADLATERERGAYMGIYNQTWYLGWAVGPVLGGFLADLIGFRWTFIVCTATIIAGLALGARFIRDTRSSSNVSQGVT
jgi:MFS family permease